MPGKKGQKIDKTKCKKFPEYYKILHPDWDNEQCKKVAKEFTKTTNSGCIEYWTKKYPSKSIIECKALLKEHLLNKKKNNVKFKEYWKSKYPEKTIEECEELARKTRREGNYQCIEYWIKRYPNNTIEECKQMLANKKKDYLSKRPDNHGKNNPMHHSRVSIQKTKEGSPMCIEFYQKRYPELSKEEQEKIWKESCDKRTTAVKNSIKTTNIEYYINKGMSIEDAKKALHDRQSTFSLNKCIEKYGREKGIEIFNNRQLKWQQSLRKNFEINTDGRCLQSNIANELIDKIIHLTHIKKYKKEKYIYDKENNHGYSYDFCYKHKLIEFQGDYWHCNPKIYKENFFNKVINLSAKEIWDKDNNKKIVAEKFGYKVLYIWEYDYKENPEREIKKCIDFLKDD